MIGNGSTTKENLLYVCFTLMSISSLLTIPILKANLIVKGNISLKAKGLSFKIKTVATLLIYASGCFWMYINFFKHLLIPLQLAARGICIYCIVITQMGTGLLVFNIAVNWVLEENIALDKATSSKDLISAYTRLINKYKHLKQGSGGLLFLMCFNFGVMLFAGAWLVTTMTFIFALPYVLVALANFVLLSVLTTLADDAYEMLFLHQEKLR